MNVIGSKISDPIKACAQTVGPEEPSDDTPSVSLSLDSSLREGAGNGCGSSCHSTGYSLNCEVAGDFHRPYGFAPPGTKEQRF